MDSRESLIALRERVAGLKEADREVDAEIGLALGMITGVRWDRDRITGERDPVGLGTSEIGKEWLLQVHIPRLTRSVDATMALIERVLPVPETWTAGSPPSSGWKISLYRGMTPTGEQFASWHAMIRRHAEQERDCIAPTPALALLLALLNALTSGGQTHG